MKAELEIKDKTQPTEGIKIATFRKNIRKTNPHKHNSYFEIIYLTKGSGSHTVDTKKFKIESPVIFTIRQEQVHFWDITSEPEGFVLIIKKQFIDNCLDGSIKHLISELSSHTCLNPNTQNDSTANIFSLLIREYQENSSSKKPVIEGLLKALLAKILESTPSNNPKSGNNNYQKFIVLLNQEKHLTNNVAYYAKLLHTTPQNLNAICRKEVDQSAAAILSEHIIGEAKRLLTYTDSTVSEISASLDFKDNSHFSKYFKRHVGSTPLEFRKGFA